MSDFLSLSASAICKEHLTHIFDSEFEELDAELIRKTVSVGANSNDFTRILKMDNTGFERHESEF